MTLFTSDIEAKTNFMKKQTVAYASVTLFVFLFGSIYEHFGHGIFSFYMQFAFLFPLVFGLIIPLLSYFIYIKKAPAYKPGAVYNYGVTVLTVGSLVKGALDIYGTTSDLVIPYFVVGTVLLLWGLLKPFTKKKSVTD